MRLTAEELFILAIYKDADRTKMIARLSEDLQLTEDKDLRSLISNQINRLAHMTDDEFENLGLEDYTDFESDD